MAFPSDDGVPELCGGIWGFGIFDSGDDARIQAAKTFIQFVCDDENQAAESVRLTGFFRSRNPWAMSTKAPIRPSRWASLPL